MKKMLPIILIVIFSCEDDGISPNFGCTDPNALNYNLNANVDLKDEYLIQVHTWF